MDSPPEFGSAATQSDCAVQELTFSNTLFWGAPFDKAFVTFIFLHSMFSVVKSSLGWALESQLSISTLAEVTRGRVRVMGLCRWSRAGACCAGMLGWLDAGEFGIMRGGMALVVHVAHESYERSSSMFHKRGNLSTIQETASG